MSDSRVSSQNVLLPRPGYGTHLKGVAAAVEELSGIPKSRGFNCDGWDKIWVHVVFRDELDAIKTCTLRPYVWQPCDYDSDETNGAWSSYRSTDLEVVEADNGRKSFLLEVNNGIIYLNPNAVGNKGHFNVYIQGAVRSYMLT